MPETKISLFIASYVAQAFATLLLIDASTVYLRTDGSVSIEQRAALWASVAIWLLNYTLIFKRKQICGWFLLGMLILPGVIVGTTTALFFYGKSKQLHRVQ